MNNNSESDSSRSRSSNFSEFRLSVEGYVRLVDSIAGHHAKARMDPTDRSIAVNNLTNAKEGAFVQSRCFHDFRKCREEFLPAALIVKKEGPAKAALKMKLPDGTEVEVSLTAREIVDDYLKSIFDAAVGSTCYDDGAVYSDESTIFANVRKVQRTGSYVLEKAVSAREFETNIALLSPKMIFLRVPIPGKPPLVVITNSDLGFVRTAYYHNPARCNPFFRTQSIPLTEKDWVACRTRGFGRQTLVASFLHLSFRNGRVVKAEIVSPVSKPLYTDVPQPPSAIVPEIAATDVTPTTTTHGGGSETMSTKDKILHLHYYESTSKEGDGKEASRAEAAAKEAAKKAAKEAEKARNAEIKANIKKEMKKKKNEELLKMMERSAKGN